MFYIRFDAIVSADAFENLKPAPDIFLSASNILNVIPSEVFNSSNLFLLWFRKIYLCYSRKGLVSGKKIYILCSLLISVSDLCLITFHPYETMKDVFNNLISIDHTKRKWKEVIIDCPLRLCYCFPVPFVSVIRWSLEFVIWYFGPPYFFLDGRVNI